MSPDPPAIIERLRVALRGPLPGHDGFLARAGYKRADIETALRDDPSPRQSAVLILLYPSVAVALREGDPPLPDQAPTPSTPQPLNHSTSSLHTLLMLRPTYAGVHSGQVSFPGGRKEAGDADHWATALREFTEETGIALDRIDRLGELSRLYIPPSRSLVTPCVAFASSPGTASPDPKEVAALMELPIDALLVDDAIRHREQFIAVAGRPVTVPYFDLVGHAVWGATAMMLWELRELLRKAG